jgi:hypothetical protein
MSEREKYESVLLPEADEAKRGAREIQDAAEIQSSVGAVNGALGKAAIRVAPEDVEVTKAANPDADVRSPGDIKAGDW